MIFGFKNDIHNTMYGTIIIIVNLLNIVPIQQITLDSVYIFKLGNLKFE